MSNAGGVGKSTLAIHLAFEVARQGYSVALLDLDPQRSLDVFCGLPPVDPTDSMVAVMSKNFKGIWPLTNAWKRPDIQICQGHPLMADMANELVTRRRGEYVLGDRLRRDPLPHDVVIVDCPATLGMLTTNALAASTHLLVPVQLEMKAASGTAGLFEWCIEVTEDLELDPRPPVLGLVPSMFDRDVAIHRQILGQLPNIAGQLGVRMYPEIRASREFKNASARGLPLQLHRPGHDACGNFAAIRDDVIQLVMHGTQDGRSAIAV